MPSRRSSKKDSPAKLAGRMKRRWRVVLLRSKGEILGTVEAPDVATARRPQRSSLISTKSSATGSWCRNSAEGGSGRGRKMGFRDLGQMFEHEGPTAMTGTQFEAPRIVL
jgi:hypothetical protein